MILISLLETEYSLQPTGADNHPPSALIGSKEEIFEKILSYGDLRIKEVVLDFITPNKNETIETMQILSEELIPNL